MDSSGKDDIICEDDEDDDDDPTSVERLREREEQGQHPQVTDITETTTHRFRDGENEDMTEYTAIRPITRALGQKIEISG